ncbi:hypothetical protein [Aquiflexum sp.]
MLKNLVIFVFLLATHLSYGQDFIKGKVLDENALALPLPVFF